MSALNQELTALRRQLLTMAAEVEQRVNQAFEGLLRHDLRLAEAVREGDDEIDRLDVDIERLCVEILALHQPVAGDLRSVLASMKINTDLERMGDLARTIAKRSIKMEFRGTVALPPIFLAMAASVRGMVHDAMGALGDRDADRAERVRRADRVVDEQHRAMLAWAVDEVGARRDHARAVIDMLTIVRAAERIADLAKNICESVIYAVGGQVVRHSRVAPDGPVGPQEAA